MKKSRNNAVEWLRYIGTLEVVLLHFEVERGRFYFGTNYLWVEFFFILSGFFLYQNFIQHKGSDRKNSAIRYTVRRFARIAPAYYTAFFLLFAYTCFNGSTVRLYDYFWELVMLQATGVTGDIFNFYTWYISSLLIVGYFIYALLELCEHVFLTLIAPFLVFLIYGHYAAIGVGLDFTVAYERLCTGGMNRAVAGMALGCLCYKAYEWLKTQELRRWQIVFLSVAEAAVYFMAFNELFCKQRSTDNLRVLLFFPVMITLAYLQKTVLARGFSRLPGRWLGKLSLYIFLNQGLMMSLYRRLIGPEQSPLRVRDIAGILTFCTALALLGLGVVQAGRLVFQRWSGKGLVHPSGGGK